MSKVYAIYNPFSDNKLGEERAKKLVDFFSSEDNVEFINITKLNDYKEFFDGLEAEDKVVICGGDGTLNCIINKIHDISIKNDILYYATGSGNDFLRDLEKTPDDGPIKINEHLTNLPIVTVNGKEYRFINGVGFGIDGYCCEVGDKMRALSTKKINYTSIAIKGLLFHYKPTNATITVDGETKEFKKVWIAPTMVGRYYGGGMNPAPKQRRQDREDHVSLSLLFGTGKIHTLLIFPSLFKGEHVKHTKHTAVFEGKSIKVEFDRPVSLQIDGETILNVKEYEVKLASSCKSKNTVKEVTTA